MLRRVWVSKEVIEFVSHTAEEALPVETGGLLLGYRSEDAREAVVQHATGPGPAARHRRSSFDPDQSYDVEVVREYFNESGGRVAYLGDWHSHKDSLPALSRRDKRTLRRIAQWRPARAPEPLMLVVGNLPEAEIAVWVWSGLRRRFLFRSDDVRVVPMRVYSERT